MELIFKTLTEAFTVIYDDLGRMQFDQTHMDNCYESCPRGRKCHELINVNVTLTEPANCLMWSNYRRLSPIYLAREEKWYRGGSRLVKDAPSKVWDQLQNTDDVDNGLINSNYGSYIFTQPDNKNPQTSVWEATVDLLKRDPDSRQAVLQIPIMPHRSDKDTPCTSSIQFLLRDNKLHCVVYMRSCDLWFGFPNDVTQFILWQMDLAKRLDVELGTYTHHCGSLHVYEENFIQDDEEFNKSVDEIYINGQEDIGYFKYFDTRNYRYIFDEIKQDFETLTTIPKKEIIEKHLLKNEELNIMLNQMQVSNFIN